jgi:hypothetical protein
VNRIKQKNVAYKTVVVVNGRSKPNPNFIAPVQYVSQSEFNQNSVTNSGSKRQVYEQTRHSLKTTVSVRRRNAWQASP